MKIYGSGSSRSVRAVWAAIEADVPFEYISLDFGSKASGGNHSEEYLKINSQGKFPSLVNEDLVLTESGAIVNYLAGLSLNKSLKPKDDTLERAAYDQICFFILTELEQPLWSNGKHRFALPEDIRLTAMVEKTAPFEFAKAQKALLGIMDDRPYAAGDCFTMADVLLGHTVAWAYNFKFEVSPELLAYKDRVFEREAYIKAKALVS